MATLDIASWIRYDAGTSGLLGAWKSGNQREGSFLALGHAGKGEGLDQERNGVVLGASARLIGGIAVECCYFM